METRHPHPHVDPRVPRESEPVSSNPPVFVWKPDEPAPPYRVEISADESFTRIVAEADGLADPVFLPVDPIPPGRYWWRWSSRIGIAPVFEFTVPDEVPEIPVPPASEWLERLSPEHPRLYLRMNDLDSYRERLDTSSNPHHRRIVSLAETIVDTPHRIEEPGYLPDRTVDYSRFVSAFQRIMWETREFAWGATRMALGWLVSGNARFGRAACERFVSLSRWDPDGSSALDHNDEAHMPIIWHGTAGIDLVWGLFTEDERRLVANHLAKRAHNTFAHMHGRGTYGITRFDSHAGREIIFLAWTILGFHEQIPDSIRMLEWLRPVLCGIWPVWAQDDGSWAEGIPYSLPYVQIMSEFAYLLKHRVGVNLFARGFWSRHADWREACMPAYAEWIGFGDQSEVWRQTVLNTADLVELIDTETGAGDHHRYIEALRDRGTRLADRPKVMAYQPSLPAIFSPLERDEMPGGSRRSPTGTHTATGGASDGRDRSGAKRLRVFPDCGWASIRSDPEDREHDMMMLFRSSPYGSISHSHADNNDFALHVGGRAMLIPSGYYAGYGSPHHANWVWHTKSHNCVTLSGGSQLQRSYESAGRIADYEEGHGFAYLRGEAAPSYGGLAPTMNRHLLFLASARVFLIVDTFRADRGIQTGFEWHVHANRPFFWDDDARRFRVEVEASDDGVSQAAAVDGWILNRRTAYCHLFDGFVPPPQPVRSAPTWPNQYHLTFGAGMLVDRMLLPVLLAPAADAFSPPRVETGEGWIELTRDGSVTRIAWDDDQVLVSSPSAELTIGYDAMVQAGKTPVDR